MPKPYSIHRGKPVRLKPTMCRGGLPHHWKLGDPAGGRVVGVCRRCRKKRDWPASLDVGYTMDAVISDPLPKRTNVGGYGTF